MRKLYWHGCHPIAGTTAERTAAAATADWHEGETWFDTDLNLWLVNNTVAGQFGSTPTWQRMDGGAAVPVQLAAAGSAAGDAAALSPGFTWVTGANGVKGVILPVPTPGTSVQLKNDETANAALLVYPNSGAKINGLSINGAITMVAKTACEFLAVNSTAWVTFPDVPS